MLQFVLGILLIAGANWGHPNDKGVCCLVQSTERKKVQERERKGITATKLLAFCPFSIFC